MSIWWRWGWRLHVSNREHKQQNWQKRTAMAASYDTAKSMTYAVPFLFFFTTTCKSSAAACAPAFLQALKQTNTSTSRTCKKKA